MKKLFYTILFLLLFVVSSLADTAKQVDFLLAGVRHPTTDVVLSGGKVWVFLDGTSTMSSLWTDKDKGGTATNPIILDSAGKTEVYGDDIYKFEIYDSDDVLIETINGLEYKPLAGDAVNLSFYGCNLYDAVTSIGSINNTHLIVNCKPDDLTASLEITDNIVIEWRMGYPIGGAYTLTFNVDPISGEYQIFESTLTVAGLKVSKPRWFGAQVDNSTDDLASYQKAVLAISGGGKLIVPNGISVIEQSGTNQLTLYDDITIQFESINAVLKIADGQAVDDLRLFYIFDLDNVNIVGPGRIDGNESNFSIPVATDDSTKLIYIRKSRNVTVRDMHIYESYGDAILIGKGADICEDVKILDNFLYSNRSGAINVTGAHDVALRGNSCYLNTGVTGAGFGISIEPSDDVGSEVENIIVENNNLYENDFGFTVGGSATYYCKGLIVTGNTIKENTTRGASVKWASHTVFSNNDVRDNAGQGALFWGANVSAQPIIGCSITGNSFYSNGTHGLELNESSQFSISGNSFIENDYHGLYLERASTYCDTHAITGNNFSTNSQGSANTYDNLHLGAGSHYCTITGNTFSGDNTGADNETGVDPRYNIYVNASSTNNTTINGNNFSTEHTPTTGNIFDDGERVKSQLGTNGGEEVTITTDAQTLLTFGTTEIDTTAGALAGTLPDCRYTGQMVAITMTVDGGDYTLTVTNHATSTPEVFTFDDKDDTLILIWTGDVWSTVTNFGVTT